MKIYFVKLTGGCMRPLLRSGMVCAIYPAKKISVGDIILYEHYGQKFLHRVVKVLEESVVTTDDCGICGYITVSKNCIIGKYHSLFSGFVGYLYHIITRKFFVIGREIKKFLS